MACPVCRRGFVPGGRRRYCSDACRAAAFRRRASAPSPVVVPAARSRRTSTVYECDGCGDRRVGEQRCVDCHRFMRRIGPGGACPGCDEAITVEELLGDGLAGRRLDPASLPGHDGRPHRGGGPSPTR